MPLCPGVRRPSLWKVLWPHDLPSRRLQWIIILQVSAISAMTLWPPSRRLQWIIMLQVSVMSAMTLWPSSRRLQWIIILQVSVMSAMTLWPPFTEIAMNYHSSSPSSMCYDNMTYLHGDCNELSFLKQMPWPHDLPSRRLQWIIILQVLQVSATITWPPFMETANNYHSSSKCYDHMTSLHGDCNEL